MKHDEVLWNLGARKKREKRKIKGTNFVNLVNVLFLNVLSLVNNCYQFVPMGEKLNHKIDHLIKLNPVALKVVTG